MVDDPIIDWLLDTDPSIRWQVMRDLTDTPADVFAAERSRVALEGWGAQLLDQQHADGNWGDGVTTPRWWSNLRAAGVRSDVRVEEAVRTVLARRQDDGRWLLDVRHRNTLHEELAGTVGAPNRWTTLRALRVLAWYAPLD